jgi:hypothetical protein
MLQPPPKLDISAPTTGYLTITVNIIYLQFLYTALNERIWRVIWKYFTFLVAPAWRRFVMRFVQANACRKQRILSKPWYVPLRSVRVDSQNQSSGSGSNIAAPVRSSAAASCITTMSAPALALGPALLTPLVVGVAVQARLDPPARRWHSRLRKAPARPVAAAFPVVWTYSYLALGFASYLVWKVCHRLVVYLLSSCSAWCVHLLYLFFACHC